MTQIADNIDNNQVVQSETMSRPSTPKKNIITCQIHNCSSISSTYINNDNHHNNNITKDPLIDVSGILFQLSTPKRPINELALSPSLTPTSPKLDRCGDIYSPKQCASYNILENELTFHDSSNLNDYDEDLEDNIVPCRKISNGLKIRLNRTLVYLQNDLSYKSLSDLDFNNDLSELKKHTRDLELEENDISNLELSRSKDKRFCDRYDNNNSNNNNHMLNNPKRNRSPKKTIIQKKRC